MVDSCDLFTNSFQGPFLLTWLNLNPRMDK